MSVALHAACYDSFTVPLLTHTASATCPGSDSPSWFEAGIGSATMPAALFVTASENTSSSLIFNDSRLIGMSLSHASIFYLKMLTLQDQMPQPPLLVSAPTAISQSGTFQHQPHSLLCHVPRNTVLAVSKPIIAPVPLGSNADFFTNGP